MRDWFRRALHPTLPVAIIASLWALASSQRPPLDRIYIGTWMDRSGVFVTGDPYARDVNPLFLPTVDEDESAEPDADAKPEKPTALPAYVGADVEEF